MQVGKTEHLCSFRKRVGWSMQQVLCLNGAMAGKHPNLEQIEETGNLYAGVIL